MAVYPHFFVMRHGALSSCVGRVGELADGRELSRPRRENVRDADFALPPEALAGVASHALRTHLHQTIQAQQYCCLGEF